MSEPTFPPGGGTGEPPYPPFPTFRFWLENNYAAGGWVQGPTFGDTKYGYQTVDHNGWVKLDGRATSTLTVNQQNQCTSLGIGVNIPNMTNKYLSQGVMGTEIGNVSNTVVLSQSNLPNVTLNGTTASSGTHTHGLGGTIFFNPFPEPGIGAIEYIGSGNTTGASGAHTHTFTTSSLNGGVAQTQVNITPRTLLLNCFIYLGL